MNRYLLMMITLMSLVLSSTAYGSSWTIDTDHSNAQFRVRHMMVANVRGNFSGIKGTVHIDDEDVTQSHVDVTIDVNSLDTGVAKRDEFLKSPLLFDASRFPTYRFTSKRVEKSAHGTLKVVGDLSLHGVTREVGLEVQGLAEQVRDPWGRTRTGTQATARINRKDFGIVWNMVLDNGGVLVGNEVAITIDLALIKNEEIARGPTGETETAQINESLSSFNLVAKRSE
jgi:polyisoprenoid-binding protein YceI